MSPVKLIKEELKSEYTSRAERSDAQTALRGDLVRGMVEVITNPDDAYERAGKKGGPIRITVEHLDEPHEHIAHIRISDAATGIAFEDLKPCLVDFGKRESGFDAGKSVRGLHGRGFKDVASLGSVEFESIKDGKWSKLVKEVGVDATRMKHAEDGVPMEEIRDRLGLEEGESGATVTIKINRPCHASSDPMKVNLFECLCSHAELRHIIADRDVTFEEVGKRKTPSRPLAYEPPIGKEALRKVVPIPGYKEATAELVVFEMNEAQEDVVGNHSHHGILIKGNRAVYANTLYKWDNAEGRYLRGHFSCPYIDDLARDYDDRKEQGKKVTKENPLQLLTRSRDGLLPEHPFAKRVKEVISTQLAPLIEDLERRHRGNRKIGKAAQARLNRLARELSTLLEGDLKDLDDPFQGVGVADAPIRFILNSKNMKPDSKETLTIHVRPRLMAGTWDHSLEPISDVPAIVRVDGGADEPKIHPHDQELFVSRIRIKSGLKEGNAQIEIRAGDFRHTCKVTVDGTSPPPPPPPQDFEFERDACSIGPGKKRWIVLRAPLDLVLKQGDKVQITAKGDQTITLLSKTVTLELDPQLGWCVGRVQVVGTEAGAECKLTAALKENKAFCKLKIVKPTDPHGLDFELKWAEGDGKQRGVLVPDGGKYVLTIYGRHKAIQPLLGKYDQKKEDYENSNAPEVSQMMAEVIASEVTHFIVERDMNRPGQDVDPARYAVLYRKRLNRYLMLAQQMLAIED